ncbi:MAG TPA: ATP-binding cassette domain-containing protein [Draconibacterium sp.]|nr:ATP-binding cassette domain-containing protein [Draconibacterium sp.]
MQIDAGNIIEVKKLGYRVRNRKILHNLNFAIGRGEAFVITGPSGSGKTILAEILAGNVLSTEGQVWFDENFEALMVSQQDRFVTASGIRVSYYSQRYESLNEEGIPTLTEYLHRTVPGIQPENFLNILKELEIESLAKRKILSLSNGERKRVQIAEALLQNPNVLILDQPFTGLDVQSREILVRILERQKKSGISLVIISDEFHIPPFTDYVLSLALNGESQLVRKENFQHSKQDYLNIALRANHEFLSEIAEVQSPSHLVVQMKDVTISYRGEKVLQNISWTVLSGDRWLLYGPNGAGKTTLLSLVSADNPQGYSNDIVLFDRKRGSGESIWEIKKKIGFVSPELHHYFLRRKSIYKPAAGEVVSYNGLSCLDVVLSGLKDEVGFTTLRSKLEVELARKWMYLMGLEHLEKTSFLQSSLGEQRNILLVRALVKSPELLILDEPCQGMDYVQIQHFISLLDLICSVQHTTLIYVTHRAEEIPACITHELALEKGCVVKNSPLKGN